MSPEQCTEALMQVMDATGLASLFFGVVAATLGFLLGRVVRS